MRIVNKNTELFSTYDADTLFETILDFAEKQGYKFQASPDKYKAKIEILLGEEVVDITAKVTKAAADKNVVEITRTGGDSILFFEQFKIIKDYLGELVDATY